MFLEDVEAEREREVLKGKKEEAVEEEEAGWNCVCFPVSGTLQTHDEDPLSSTLCTKVHL